MNIYNGLGFMLFVSLFVSSLLLGENSSILFNQVAIVLVVSGTIGAVFISYPYNDIKAALFVARNSYGAKPPTPSLIVNALLDLSVRSRHDGLLSLEK
ncbi:MAG: flagellar motor protein MotA, partial [Gammaproteobacteria bacterium]|nr:flagellar motor protein MotA [Gammaproteobacteria bacterium]